MPSKKQRITSIDVFRALTMLLMIFVNDLWTLTDVPKWLEHTAAEEDGMGLADVVFPAFLFIVGLSIPFAKKDLPNILWRSLALLIMGFFHVNMENYNDATAWLPKPLWMILLTLSFFLIWLDYAKPQRLLQALGVALLIFLAFAFNAPMKMYWWGILGLIGRAYLICSLIFMVAPFPVLVAALIFFNLFNIFVGDFFLGDGSNAALVMAGVLTATLYKKDKLLLIAGILFIAAGFAIRPWEGISKIRATPAWVFICTGISILAFLLLDKWNKEIKLIKPAGTSTLTAYLLPYFFYALGIQVALSGVIGLIKSFLFAVAIILLTGLLEKKRLRLKI